LHYTKFTLGPTNPSLTNIKMETLGFRRSGFSPDSRYSYRHSHLMPLQTGSHQSFTAASTLPYQPILRTGNSNIQITICLPTGRIPNKFKCFRI